jgi:predicted RNase H-like nuclease
MLIAGVDLAWQSEKNGTSVALGELSDGVLSVSRVSDDLRSINEILRTLALLGQPDGVAIDGPLILRNETGQRPCEQLVSKAYGAKKASCHTSNLRLYPDPAGVRLSARLQDAGYAHLGEAPARWQIECYPHPALIEIFGLPERLPYKKGTVAERCSGQADLSRLILSLRDAPFLSLQLTAELIARLTPNFTASLKGKALKRNEDFLDSLLCLYIAGLYASGIRSDIYGDGEWGYIFVPKQRCA